MKIFRQESYNISHKGLTKVLSKRMYIDGKKDIVEIINRRATKDFHNTNVGQLPPILFNAIKKEDRNNKIKEIIRIFEEVSDEIRDFRVGINSPYEERVNKRPQSAVLKLKKVFVDLNLINENDKFDLKFLGEGNYKKAYKLEGIKDPKTGEELCYKVFHVVDKTPEWHKYKTHGNYAELNTAIYWMKQFGYETQRGKFYFGDINHGFFVDKFIDDNVAPPKKDVEAFVLGLKLTDEFSGGAGHNRINGYSIDPGGPRIVNRVKNKSKIARKIFHDIEKLPLDKRESEWRRILLEDNHLDFSQKMAGLAISIKHLEKRSNNYDICLKFNNPLVDMGLAYVLKYQKPHNTRRYFEALMNRGNSLTQVVLLNELPLIARYSREQNESHDDLDVPKGQISTRVLDKYYELAKQYVLPEAEEHLASYIHLLPQEKIIPEAARLIKKNKYEIIDRLLHKIKFVKDEEFSFSTKMEIINIMKKYVTDEFLLKKLNEVRVYIIRNQLED